MNKPLIRRPLDTVAVFQSAAPRIPMGDVEAVLSELRILRARVYASQSSSIEHRPPKARSLHEYMVLRQTIAQQLVAITSDVFEEPDLYHEAVALVQEKLPWPVISTTA